MNENDNIFTNPYEGKNLNALTKNELEPFVAFTIRENQEQCKIHRIPYEKIQLTYKRGRGTYSVVPKYCKACNKLFVEESKSEYIADSLTKRGVENRIYPLHISAEYIQSQISEIEFGEEDVIYIPDVWVEEKMLCPIHNIFLEEYPYVKRYKGREVKFTGYYCGECNKIILRRTKALALEDECSENGIPIPKIKPLIEKIQIKKTFTQKDIKPDYYIEDGKKNKFDFDTCPQFYLLTEGDTIVVSDSAYCSLYGHDDIEEVKIVFWVNQKRDGRKLFLCLAGYCGHCQKYYVEKNDYEVIYELGRPEVMVLSDLEDTDYRITSGEVFELEKRHLEALEHDFDVTLDAICNASDYMNPYAVISGGYDDGALKSSKIYSKEKYQSIIKKITGYKSKPYTYRVDITFNKKSEVYYIGADDIELDGDRKVISYNSDFGKKLVNYRTLNIIKDGKQYDIKLQRRFDLADAQLFGYENIRTDEDIIFREGITDPFLIKVLHLRKKQHNLIDIISTIQENQNTIVDEKMNQNIIVQGCAGSGKTMVLLHRISSLKYNHPKLDLSDILILTPNEQFNLHIKGLAEDLQIGNIDRLSVEQYYQNILRQYSSEFALTNKLASELTEQQIFVDYIYSNAFLEKFNAAYVEVLNRRNELITMLQNVSEALEKEYKVLPIKSDSEFVPAMQRRVEYLYTYVAARKKELSDAENALETVKNRKSELDEKIPQAKLVAMNIVQDVLPRVFSKIASYIADVQHDIEEQQTIAVQKMQEITEAENRLLPLGKKRKIEKLKKEYDEATNSQNNQQVRLDEAKAVFDFETEGRTDEVILTWMGKVNLYIPSIQDEIKLCVREKGTFEKLLKEQIDVEEKIKEGTKAVEEATEIQYSHDTERGIVYLREKLSEYAAIKTYHMVFDKATEDFVKLHDIKRRKTMHRYDLYAQLWFCMKFYGKKINNTKLICVDEGQDIAFNEYRMIYELNDKDVIFNIYGDTNQLLKPQRGIEDWSRLRTEFNMREYHLNENYRNTNQITKFCNNSFDMNVSQTGVDGAKVHEILRRELEKELAQLNVDNKRVAILVPRCIKKKQYLEWDLLPSHIKGCIGDKIDNGVISFMYVDEVKGIEFDKVFVIPNRMTKNEKYIAYTRALSELIIVVDDKIDVQ